MWSFKFFVCLLMDLAVYTKQICHTYQWGLVAGQIDGTPVNSLPDNMAENVKVAVRVRPFISF